jgi:hypothetical protein
MFEITGYQIFWAVTAHSLDSLEQQSFRHFQGFSEQGEDAIRLYGKAT